jgi:hypothetical protein
MDADLGSELSAFSPRWQTPQRRLPATPDLPWLTILLDESCPNAGPQVTWVVAAARAAARQLDEIGLSPGPLEVWLEGRPLSGPGIHGVTGLFGDGVVRIALSNAAPPFSIVHEAAHFVTISGAFTPARRQGAERLALILLEEYLAERMGIVLLAELALDDHHSLIIREARGQAVQIVSDYRMTRAAFRALIESAQVPDDLGDCTFALTRTLAYLTGARTDEAYLTGLPKRIGRRIAAELRPALTGITLPVDLRTDRLTLAARIGLTDIMTDLLSEVVSNALTTTPLVRRHKDWPLAFGQPLSSGWPS